jgi:hypothetical protein
MPFMGEPTDVLDPTLFRLTMSVVAEMDAKVSEYLARDGHTYVPHRRRRRVSSYDSGWPNVGSEWPGGKETESVAYGELFGLDVGTLNPFAYRDISQLGELRAYIEGTPSIVDRIRMPVMDGKHDDIAARMFEHEVADLPASIFDRAKALGLDVDGPGTAALYRLREMAWLGPELDFQLVVPLVLTDIDIEQALEIGPGTRIEPLNDDDLRAMANDYDVSGVPGPVADAVRFAVVIDMPPMPNPGPGRRLLSGRQQPDTTEVDTVCEALRIVTSRQTGWARVFRRPMGWADHWKDDLPEYHLLHTARRYPTVFDNYGWLEPVEKITGAEIEYLPTVASALASASQPTRLAARRLSMAQVRDTPDDRLIDACIGLEALLGQKDAELSYRVALRAAALLSSRADNSMDPEGVFRVARQVYARRSDLVHGNTSTKRATMQLSPEGPNLPTSALAVWLLREVLRERLLRADKWKVEDLDAYVLTRLASVPAPDPASEA